VVTLHNGTDEELNVLVESGQDVAQIDGVALGAKGHAVLCPRRDSSIVLVFPYGRQVHMLDLDAYTCSGAIGSASATVIGRTGEDPQLEDVTCDSGYSFCSVLPQGLFARGVGLGLALGLLVAAWACRRCGGRRHFGSGPDSSGKPLPAQ
jgi:hypothetical protein